MSRQRADVTSKAKSGANRVSTTMRLQPDIREATDAIAAELGMSRTQFVEQVLAKQIRAHGGHTIRLRSLL